MANCLECGVELQHRRWKCIAHGWEATPGPQSEFMGLRSDEMLYGGAAGGGKTDSIVMKPLGLVHNPTFNGIIFRRTFPELVGQVIPKSMEWYSRVGGKYNKVDHCWTFPSGARIHFGHLQYLDDVHRYQGWEFQYIGFDELTTFLREQYVYLKSRLRSSSGVPCFMASATNPGGEGHEWVCERWAPWLLAKDPNYRGPKAAPGEVMYYVTGPNGREWVPKGTPGAMSQVFIPARLTDNPYLDAQYANRLGDLDRHTRSQLLDGDWLSRPATKDFFDRTMFPMLDERPAGRVQWCRWWDRAATTNASSDYTAGVLLGRTEQNQFVVGDVARFKAKPHEVVERIKWYSKNDPPRTMIRGGRDPGSAGEFEASMLVRELSGCDVEFLRETGDKIDRARPVSSQAKAGHISVVRGAWNRDFFDELEAAPLAGHDDQMDGLSGAFSVLNSGGAYAAFSLRAAMEAARSDPRFCP